MPEINAITPFLPARDFGLSLQFYSDLGFSTMTEIAGAVRLEMDGCSFWLQNYYVKEWADNAMLCLYVADIDSWWSKIDKLNIDEKFGHTAKVLSKPHDQEGGRMMQITDPSGVLWHIRQAA
jgi:hypothetical protein